MKPKQPLISLRRHWLRTTLFVACLLAYSAVFAAKPVYSGGRERAAIRGYDPVAYFTQNKPVKGNSNYELTYKGAKWLFSSAENKALFEQSPEKYSPQFGGYCAYAVARNTTASIKPEYFAIVDDKLYLNYSKSVYNKWIEDKERFIKDANANWPKVIDR